MPTYKRGKKISYKIPIIISIVVVAAILIGFVFVLTSPTIYTITSTTKFYINGNSNILYRLPYSPYVYALYLRNSTNSSALFYVTKVPILAYPVLALYMPSGTSANISSSGAQVSDIHIYLLSSSPKGANVEITPIDPSLGIKESGIITVLQPTEFTEKMLYTGNVIIITTTSTTTSTSITTTTINQSNINQSNIIPMQEIMSFLNTTNPGILMNNFNLLYNKDTACNASVYNATFQVQENTKPTGPLSFYNVSPSVPRYINVNVTRLSSSKFLVKYIGVTLNTAYTSPLMVVTVSLTPTPIIANLSFEGPFQNMNLTQVTQVYNFQNSIHNFCGAYIPYIPH